MSGEAPGQPPPAPEARALDAPYPLLRRFRRRIVPGAALFVVLAAIMLGYTVNRVIERVYLEIAEVRANAILRSIQAALPATAAALAAGKLADGDVRALQGFVAGLAADTRLQRFKIYDLSRRVLFSSTVAEIGGTEDNPALRAVIASRARRLVDHRERDGTRVYELYVPLVSPEGRFHSVMELYEPTEFLDRTVAAEVWPPIVLAAALFVALFAALYFIVRRGQADITARTEALGALRRRLERFVSTSAVGAVHAAKGGPVASRRVEATLLYADVRGFTSYAEANEPERAIALLNAVLAIEIDAVGGNGGDVDKMIGDALLARFAGEGRQNRALRAAAGILAGVRAANLPRGIGIGVYDGTVIVGALGPEKRQDFTVIGDAVNTAARLCSAAKEGELVADVGTLRAAGWPVAAEEEIVAKGKQVAVIAGRYATDAANAHASRD